MARRKQSRGSCVYCGKDYTAGGMSRHLRTCKERQAAIAKADAGRGRAQPLYHLLVRGTYAPFFWLHLELPGRTMLDDLDSYLRAIWLECCGHLSMFRINDQYYTDPRAMDDMFDDEPMTIMAQKVLHKGLVFEYEYDFGSTTYLVLQVVDERQGKPTTRHPLALMARNYPPELTCGLCDRPATWVCVECQYEEDMPHFFCDEHGEEHEHEDMLLAVVNSPRIGECAYDGPAEPPY